MRDWLLRIASRHKSDFFSKNFFQKPLLRNNASVGNGTEKKTPHSETKIVLNLPFPIPDEEKKLS